MESLLLKDVFSWIIGTGGTMGLLAIGIVVWFNKRIGKNGEKIAVQAKEDKKHEDILNKHDTAIQLLEQDVGHVKESVVRIEKQNGNMDKKLDQLLLRSK